jgi:23S rRNA (uracil1939-C5)-methyltransferase
MWIKKYNLGAHIDNFVEKKQATLVGFREKHNPRYVTEISECPILNAKVDAHIPSFRKLLDNMDDSRSIAQIEIAAGDATVALIFRHLVPLSPADQQRLRDFADQTGFIIFLQPKGPDSVHLFYPETGESWLSYTLPETQICFKFLPTDFTQVNMSLNQAMITQAIDLLAPNKQDRVLDLFCGLGNFSLPLAKQVAFVLGVEGSVAMVQRAQMNAAANNINHAEFIEANLHDEAELGAFHTRAPFHKVLLDPPRTGALAVVKQIDKIAPERIVYVSCNPATLARDAGILVNSHGYHLACAGVMDMFPQTAHVESIALFVKG